MTGFDEFMGVFGEITVTNVVQILLAGVFLTLAYRKFKKYLTERHDQEQLQTAQLQEALESVRKYPEYRQQSIYIQQELERKIQEISTALAEQTTRMVKMEKDAKRRERSKLKDRLLQSYRYYTDKERNPLGAWTSMEAEAFWELFKEYEEAGGNGYIHTVVQPAMSLLKVIDIEDVDSVLRLTNSRIPSKNRFLFLTWAKPLRSHLEFSVYPMSFPILSIPFPFPALSQIFLATLTFSRLSLLFSYPRCSRSLQALSSTDKRSGCLCY